MYRRMLGWVRINASQGFERMAVPALLLALVLGWQGMWRAYAFSQWAVREVVPPVAQMQQLDQHELFLEETNTALLGGVCALLGYCLIITRKNEKEALAVQVILTGYKDNPGMLGQIAILNRQVDEMQSFQAKLEHLREHQHNLQKDMNALVATFHEYQVRQAREEGRSRN